MLLKHSTGFKYFCLLNTSCNKKRIVTNILCTNVLIKTFTKHFRRWSERSISDIRYVPDVYTTFLQLFVCMAIHDTIFYHAHRLVLSYYCFIKCLQAYQAKSIL